MRYTTITPSAARLTNSLRDIGYDFPGAVADIVDNSISAGAGIVKIHIDFAGVESTVRIEDDGQGMTPGQLSEALRFGSRQDYGHKDLGRYGLGLKTASLSQGRSVTVVSRRQGSGRTHVRQLDVDVVEEWDEWLILDPGQTATVRRAKECLPATGGTTVIWENLDRVLPQGRPDGGWARRRLDGLVSKSKAHLSMVFHRFLEGTASGRQVKIEVNGEQLSPWNPFAPSQLRTQTLTPVQLDVELGDSLGSVRLERFVLPNRSQFTSNEEFERMAGPLKWNRQQGLYLYRADRLVHGGGWAGLRAIDEHTKLARAALSFDPELDALFNINVAKMRASVPVEIKQLLERSLNELCSIAQAVYRDGADRKEKDESPDRAAPSGSNAADGQIGLALTTAAMQSGDLDALQRILAVVQEHSPDLLARHGLAELAGFRTR